jgi:hypothetical protein
MRPVTISLDATTWELAKRKTNFSEWVRNKLRSERNQGQTTEDFNQFKIDKLEKITKMNTNRLLYQLELLTESELTALVSILQGSLPQQ